MHSEDADPPPLSHPNVEEREEKLRKLHERKIREFTVMTSHLCKYRLTDEDGSEFVSHLSSPATIPDNALPGWVLGGGGDVQ